MTARQTVAKALELPETAEWDQIEEQICIVRKIEEGIESYEKNGGISMEAMDERIAKVIARYHK